MYEQFFGLAQRPFAAAPSLDFIVEHAGYVAARDAVVHCLRDAAGIAVVTAPAGLGKSLLCLDLQRQLQGEFQVVYLCSAQYPTRQALLQAILFELGASYRGLSEDEARLAVVEAIRAGDRDLILIVDEVHLVSSELLEELRTLAEPSPTGARSMRLVLAGQLSFEERLSDSELHALNQRIGCHAVIDPLSQEESVRHLTERLIRAGGQPDLIAPSGLAVIVTASDGNPRCLHQLSDHSLMSAFAAGERTVSVETVRNALEDLRSLPLHWNDAGLVTDEEMDDETRALLEALERPEPPIAPAAAPVENRITPDDEVISVEVGAKIDPSAVEKTLFQSVDPWQRPSPDMQCNAPEADSADVARPVAPPTIPRLAPEILDDDLDGETVVDDPYARIDRSFESQYGGQVPQAPDLMRFLSQFAIERQRDRPARNTDGRSVVRPPESSAALSEEDLLETIEELRDELRSAMTDREVEREIEHDPADAWKAGDRISFDVVEPEEAPEAIAPVAPQEPPLPPVAPAPVEPQDVRVPEPSATRSTSIDPPHEDPALRYSNLFTRIRQRRRVARERLGQDDWV